MEIQDIFKLTVGQCDDIAISNEGIVLTVPVEDFNKLSFNVKDVQVEDYFLSSITIREKNETRIILSPTNKRTYTLLTVGKIIAVSTRLNLDRRWVEKYFELSKGIKYAHEDRIIKLVYKSVNDNELIGLWDLFTGTNSALTTWLEITQGKFDEVPKSRLSTVNEIVKLFQDKPLVTKEGKAFRSAHYKSLAKSN